MFIKSWEKTKGKEVRYIQLYDNKIVIGSHFGNGHTDNAGSCSIQEFLDGKYQSLVISDFNKKTLQEVLIYIKKKN